MNLFVIGINHKTAPIQIREKFYLRTIEQDYLLSELKSSPFVLETFVLSTCNRTEIYINFLEGYEYCEPVLKILFNIKKIPYSENLCKKFYVYQQEKAVDHLLHVATGLDSLVIGEKQILGQLKKTVERAQSKQMFHKRFNVLSNIAVRAGKKAQTETNISYGGSSVSGVAVKMLEEEMQSLNGKSVLILGAGKMSELAADRLADKGLNEVFVMNRSLDKAKRLAKKLSAKACPFFNLREVLINVDACICSTGAPHFVIEKDIMQNIVAEREGRKLVLIDISMPRNIDPRIGKFKDIFLYSIDDLNKVIEANMAKRLKAVEDVKAIIAAKQKEFYQKMNKLTALDNRHSVQTAAVK